MSARESRETGLSHDPVYHLKLRPGDLPPVVLLPGDPGRVERIAATWDDAEDLAENREFRSARGRYRGVELGVVSSGIGGPSASIAVEELARLGVRTIVRVGSAGAVGRWVRPGSVVISTASMRSGGTTADYVPLGYPAAADPDVVLALTESAVSLGIPHHRGFTASMDSFYVGEGRPGFDGFLPVERRDVTRTLRSLRILAIEMECATVFTLSALYGLRAGAVLAVFGDRGEAGPVPAGEEEAIRVANDAVLRLATIAEKVPPPPPARAEAPSKGGAESDSTVDSASGSSP